VLIINATLVRSGINGARGILFLFFCHAFSRRLCLFRMLKCTLLRISGNSKIVPVIILRVIGPDVG